MVCRDIYRTNLVKLALNFFQGLKKLYNLPPLVLLKRINVFANLLEPYSKTFVLLDAVEGSITAEYFSQIGYPLNANILVPRPFGFLVRQQLFKSNRMKNNHQRCFSSTCFAPVCTFS